MSFPLRPLSNRASTASCSIRFSFRMMISGADRSRRRFSRLFRLMTRRYRSFRSEVANRPPSSGTRGRRSGGRTGMTCWTIHSGFCSLSRNASTIFSRLEIFFFFASDAVSPISLRSDSESFARSSPASSVRIASAPIPTRNRSRSRSCFSLSPLKSSRYSSNFSRYFPSVRTSCGCVSVSHGSRTMYFSK